MQTPNDDPILHGAATRGSREGGAVGKRHARDDVRRTDRADVAERKRVRERLARQRLHGVFDHGREAPYGQVTAD